MNIYSDVPVRSMLCLSMNALRFFFIALSMYGVLGTGKMCSIKRLFCRLSYDLVVAIVQGSWCIRFWCSSERVACVVQGRYTLPISNPDHIELESVQYNETCNMVRKCYHLLLYRKNLYTGSGIMNRLLNRHLDDDVNMLTLILPYLSLRDLARFSMVSNPVKDTISTFFGSHDDFRDRLIQHLI